MLYLSRRMELLLDTYLRKVARMCSLFIRRGGTIKCIVNRRKRYSRDIPQGGLEIPCTAVFTGTREEIERFKRLCRQDLAGINNKHET